MDNVRTVKKTEQVHEVDFLMLGTQAPFSYNLREAQGDEVKELADCFVVLKKSITPPEMFTVYKHNLLVRSDRVLTIEIVPPGESALDKHLESLRQEQTHPANSAA